jgi:hypothetical protein
MLSTLDKNVAVVLMVNSSVSGKDAAVYTALLDDLWTHAESLRQAAH